MAEDRVVKGLNKRWAILFVLSGIVTLPGLGLTLLGHQAGTGAARIQERETRLTEHGDLIEVEVADVTKQVGNLTMMRITLKEHGGSREWTATLLPEVAQGLAEGQIVEAHVLGYQILIAGRSSMSNAIVVGPRMRTIGIVLLVIDCPLLFFLLREWIMIGPGDTGNHFLVGG